MGTTEASGVTQPCGVLRYSEIKRLIEEQRLIENADPQSIQPASYDVRVGERYRLPGGKIRVLEEGEIIEIPPLAEVTVQSLEQFHLPSNVVGHTGPRRHLALRLIELRDSGAQIDPGYGGHLFSRLYNASAAVQRLGYGERYATVEFRYTTPPKPEDPLYEGAFQERTFQQVLAEVMGYEILAKASEVATRTDELWQDYTGLKRELATIRPALQADWANAAREMEARVYRQMFLLAAFLVLALAAMVATMVVVLVLRT